MKAFYFLNYTHLSSVNTSFVCMHACMYVCMYVYVNEYFACVSAPRAYNARRAQKSASDPLEMSYLEFGPFISMVGKATQEEVQA